MNRSKKVILVAHCLLNPNTQVLGSAKNKGPSKEILELAKDAQVVGIDEAQFFTEDLVDVCNQLADDGKRVIVAGLDQDYRGVPFEPIPQLLARAEYITKTLAICMQCGNPADRTQRKIASKDRVVVGATDSYEARCRKCHYIPNEE